MAPLGANESCGNCRLAEAVRVEEGKQNRGGKKKRKNGPPCEFMGKSEWWRGDIRLPQLIIGRRMRIQFLNDDQWGEFCHVPRFRHLIGDFLARFQRLAPVTREERERRIKPRIYWQLDGSEACRVGDTGQLATLRYLCPFPFSGGSCSCLLRSRVGSFSLFLPFCHTGLRNREANWNS